ncbi:MAG: hypothetical protein KAR32_13235, partial [Candidatus Omnitrophica bacterium]|nr:hypothetical protein [Candidatus Omnitrophota bacterium]
MNKHILRTLISVLFLVIAVKIIWQDDYISLVKKISFMDIAITILLSFLVVTPKGFSLGYMINTQDGAKLNIIDLLTLPFMMNFWGFFIPINGGILYSIFFLKSKYKVKATDSTAITIYIQMIVFILIGFLGLCYMAVKQRFGLFSTALCLLLLFSPLFLKWANTLFQMCSFKDSGILSKIQSLVSSVVSNAVLPLRNIQTTSVIGTLSLSRILFRAVRYYWISLIFGFEIPFATVLILTLVIELSMITLRFSLGNLGVTELLSGGVMSLLGQTTQEGIIIALFCRFIHLL